MKTKLLAVAAGLAIVLAVLTLRGTGTAVPEAEPPSRRVPASGPAARVADPALPWPGRDPFRYADEAPAGATSPRAVLRVAPSLPPVPVAAASANPLRLIGLVRQGGALKAALSLWGETVVLGAGEEARGYRVLSIDEERGVSLKGPDGSEVQLRPS